MSARWDIALALLKNIPGGSTIEAVNASISSARKEAEWRIALDLFYSTRHWRLRADVVSYSAVIGGCSDGRQWLTALSLFFRMQRHCRADAAAFSAAMGACERGAAWEDSLFLLHSMKCQGVRSNAFNFAAAMSCCEAASQWQSALELLRDILKEETSLSAACVNSAASACEYSRQWHTALALLEDLRERDAASFGISVHVPGSTAGCRLWTGFTVLPM